MVCGCSQRVTGKYNMHAPFASNTNTIVEWARALYSMNILAEGGITQFYFLEMHIYEIAVGAN